MDFSQASIRLSGVTKTFGPITALDRVSLEIRRGGFMTLLGPSGCGKTTLLRLIAGVNEPDAGDIWIDGRRVNGSPPFKRDTPLVFQEYALFPHMTVYENVSYGLKLAGLKKPMIRQKVGEMLATFNLEGLE